MCFHFSAEKKKIRAGNHRDSILTAHQLNSLNQAGIEDRSPASQSHDRGRHFTNFSPTIKPFIEYIGLPTKYLK
jgi:hypothetical protein